MNLTHNQKAALFKIERQDKGMGVSLRKGTAQALLRQGLIVELRNGLYSKTAGHDS